MVPVRNVAGEGRESPAGGAGRREAFVVDPAAHLALSRRLRQEGGRIVAVYHSHVDGPARLSPSDLAAAVDGDAPVLPGTDQIVIGLERGKVAGDTGICLDGRMLRAGGLVAGSPGAARRAGRTLSEVAALLSRGFFGRVPVYCDIRAG